MKVQSILLTAYLIFIAAASGASTTKVSNVSSSSSKTSTSTSTTATSSSTSVATTYDINVGLPPSRTIICTFANQGQFDERTVDPVLPLLNSVGIEDTILFNSWVLNAPSNISIIPHSAPNEIVTAVEQQAVNGTPSLTILYPGTKIKSFDLHSFFFGCAPDTAEGVAGAAVQCTIAVAGFRSGQEVAVASYTFSPPVGELTVPMIQAVLPGTFVALQNVTIVQGDPTLDALNADDFIVTTHT